MAGEVRAQRGDLRQSGAAGECRCQAQQCDVLVEPGLQGDGGDARFHQAARDAADGGFRRAAVRRQIPRYAFQIAGDLVAGIAVVAVLGSLQTLVEAHGDVPADAGEIVEADAGVRLCDGVDGVGGLGVLGDGCDGVEGEGVEPAGGGASMSLDAAQEAVGNGPRADREIQLAEQGLHAVAPDGLDRLERGRLAFAAADGCSLLGRVAVHQPRLGPPGGAAGARDLALMIAEGACGGDECAGGTVGVGRLCRYSGGVEIGDELECVDRRLAQQCGQSGEVAAGGPVAQGGQAGGAAVFVLVSFGAGYACAIGVPSGGDERDGQGGQQGVDGAIGWEHGVGMARSRRRFGVV